MQDVSEVLRRWQAGQSARRIARDMGIDRKTVGRYIDEAKASGLVVETKVTEDVARTVGAGVQTRPLPPPSQQWQSLAQRRDQISACTIPGAHRTGGRRSGRASGRRPLKAVWPGKPGTADGKRRR